VFLYLGADLCAFVHYGAPWCDVIRTEPEEGPLAVQWYAAH
jgi:hypothetical protein